MNVSVFEDEFKCEKLKSDTMKTIIVSFLLPLLYSLNSYCQVFTFENDKIGQIPSGFFSALTGNGKLSEWAVIVDNSLPGSTQALAQKSQENVDYHFPLCINQSIEAADLTLSVEFKAVSGKIDQGAGLVWRYKDNNNYYIVRGNALEDNVVLYKCEKGKRMSLAPVGKSGNTYGMDVPVNKKDWNSLKVVVKGNKFDVLFNDKFLYSVVDDTFKEKGKVGMWTKADSYMLFDNFTVKIE